MAADHDRHWQEELLASLRNVNVIAGFDQHWYPARVVEPHSHSYYQIDYFCEGHGSVVIASREYPVKRGDLFVFNPGDVHQYEAAREKPMENIVLKFELLPPPRPIRFPNYVGNLGMASPDQRRDLEHNMARACVESNKKSSECPQIATAFACVFLALLVRFMRDVESISATGSREHCKVVMDYLSRHYDRRIALSDLAALAGVHPKYLCHKFSTEMGVAPMQALASIRIEAASKLLRDTTTSVTEVACCVGYPNIAHFSKRFKEMVGVSPSEYRRMESGAFRDAESAR